MFLDVKKVMHVMRSFGVDLGHWSDGGD